MRASDRAYAALRDEILDWRLEPGTVLGEVEQAARLGVSRTPVREALARLSADGLVETQVGRGLVVASSSIESVVALFEVRDALEGKAAALAAERRDTATFEALRDELRAIDTRDLPAYYDLVRRFDDAVDAAAGNGYLVTTLKALRTHLVRIRRLSQDNPDRLAAAASEHLLIVDAILDGNSDLARQATSVHLHRSLRAILDSTTGLDSTTDRTA